MYWFRLPIKLPVVIRPIQCVESNVKTQINKTTAALCISRRALKGKKYLFRDIHNFSLSAKIQDGRQKWQKQSFPLGTEYCCTTLRVKNSLKIALSLTISKIFSMFYFPLKSKMASKSDKNWNFSPFNRTPLYYPTGQKFARNRSISYGFWNIHTFSFSAKIQDGRQKWRKFKFFPIFIEYTCTTLRVKNLLEIALSLMVFEIFTLFHFPQKSKMAAKSGENSNFSLFS